MPVALYSHPMVQVANILLSRAHLVLVGVDQLPHSELARETARRFIRNFKPMIPEPRRSSAGCRVCWAPTATRR